MPAFDVNRKVNRGLAFFCNPDKRNILLYFLYNSICYAASFVKNIFCFYIFFLQVMRYCLRSCTVYFFIVAKGKIDRALWLIVFLQEMFCRFEQTQHSA